MTTAFTRGLGLAATFGCVACAVILFASAVNSASEDEADWEDGYRIELINYNNHRTAEERFRDCSMLEIFTEAELKAAMSQNTGDSVFHQYVDEIGMEPTKEDYDTALDIAVDYYYESC